MNSPISPGIGQGRQPIKPPAPSREPDNITKQIGTSQQNEQIQTKPNTQDSATQTTKDTVLPTKVTSLTPKAIFENMAKNAITLTKGSQELALLMATHGLEISEEMFNQVHKLLKGKTSRSAQENAILLVSKGLGETAQSTDIISNLLNKNSQLSKHLNNLSQMQQQMANFFKEFTQKHPSLLAFVGTFEEFNDNLKKFRQLNNQNALISKQSRLIDDGLTMEKFLNGLSVKYNLSQANLNQYIQTLSAFNKLLIGQLVLSQDSVKQPLGLLESYHYFQIPHPMAAIQAIEVLLRKNKLSQMATKDKKQPKNQQEKIIIQLDSEKLGVITVVLVVMGFKIWCSIYSSNEGTSSHVTAFREELSNNLKKYQYSLEDLKSLRKEFNLKKFIFPSQDISEVKQVQTEI